MNMQSLAHAEMIARHHPEQRCELSTAREARSQANEMIREREATDENE